MDAPNLTEKQAKILHYITTLHGRTGVSPTLTEIAKYVGVGRITIFEHVVALERKGYITKKLDKARSVKPTSLAWQWHEDRPYCPILNEIAGGIITNRCA